MAQLTPTDFNKPCLMTYGEIAERILFWQTGGHERFAPEGELGPYTRTRMETAQDHASRIAAGLLKLSTEDVR